MHHGARYKTMTSEPYLRAEVASPHIVCPRLSQHAAGCPAQHLTQAENDINCHQEVVALAPRQARSHAPGLDEYLI